MKAKHPQLKAEGLSFTRSRIDDEVFARWNKNVLAAEDGKGDNVISIFDVIGEDFFSGGFTAKRMSAALRAIGKDKDVVVNINSPGGDFFEGAAIYNLLAAHEGKVTVNVIGLAASAASFIAMAGDTIRISQVGFLMVHNAWSIVVGNRHDLAQAIPALEAFDGSMRELYAARTGMDQEEVGKLMDAETWINAKDAIDKGFASEVIEVKKTEGADKDKQAKAQAMRTIERALACQGFSRKERDEILKGAGTRDAAALAARDAGWEDPEKVQELLDSMKS
jgi:ATP-dependent Clp protease, protease subunit